MAKTVFHRISKLAAVGMIAAGASLMPAVTSAQDISDDDIFAMRNAAMKAIAGHMKALGAVAKGEAEADAGTVVHAIALNELAQTVPLLFNGESISEKSRAKGEIWSDWAGFMKAAGDFAAATSGVAAAAESGDAATIGAALGQIGATCGGCHKPFRGPAK